MKDSRHKGSKKNRAFEIQVTKIVMKRSKMS